MKRLTRTVLSLSIYCLISVFSPLASANPPSVEQHISHLTENLQLDPEQVQEIQSILQEQKVKEEALLAQYGIDDDFHKQMRAIHREGATEIEEQLSDEQRAKFRTLRKRHGKNRKAPAQAM